MSQKLKQNEVNLKIGLLNTVSYDLKISIICNTYFIGSINKSNLVTDYTKYLILYTCLQNIIFCFRFE